MNRQQTASVPWEITQEKVEKAVKRIIEVSHPLKLVLFGSYVRGETTIDSDLDILVVTSDEVVHPRKESVRIRRELRDAGMAMDIIVVPVSHWEKNRDVPGLIYREVDLMGRVVYESR